MAEESAFIGPLNREVVVEQTEELQVMEEQLSAADMRIQPAQIASGSRNPVSTGRQDQTDLIKEILDRMRHQELESQKMSEFVSRIDTSLGEIVRAWRR